MDFTGGQGYRLSGKQCGDLTGTQNLRPPNGARLQHASNLGSAQALNLTGTKGSQLVASERVYLCACPDS